MIKRIGEMLVFWLAIVLPMYLIFWWVYSRLEGYVTPLGSYKLRWDYLWVVAVIIYTAKGIKVVDVNQLATKTILGRDIQMVYNGPAFVPPVLCKLVPGKQTIVLQEIGSVSKTTKEGEKATTAPVTIGGELVIRGSDVPFRVTFSDHGTAIFDEPGTRDMFKPNADDPLNQRITTDPHMLIRWQIHDHRQFLKTVGSPEDAALLLEETARVTLQEYCARRTPAYTLYRLKEAQREIQQALERLIGDPDAYASGEKRPKSWGINVLGTQIQSLGLPRSVNLAMAAARDAGYAKQKTITDAEATREQKRLVGEGDMNRIEMEGEGQGNAERHRLTGRADGLRVMAEKLGIEPESVLTAETSREVANNVGNLNMSTDQPLNAILGAAVAVKQAMNPAPAALPPPAPPTT